MNTDWLKLKSYRRAPQPNESQAGNRSSHILSCGFPQSSAGKESACNTGDPGLFPGLGRSPGEGIGYPLQYSWASLVAQLVKNLAAVQETWVGKSPWRRERHFGLSTLAFWPRNSMDCIVHQVAKSRTQLSNFHFHFLGRRLHYTSFQFKSICVLFSVIS